MMTNNAVDIDREQSLFSVERLSWLWNQKSKISASELLQDTSEWPRITIVIPNYNYGEFLEASILSVLLQGYPNLELIVLDGGSTDNSLEIIKKYEPWITYWESEKDGGQTNAINKGLDLSTGQWFNWLNSDDILMPNALFNLIKISRLVPEAKWISGGRVDLDAAGNYTDICIPWRTDPSNIALGAIFLPQDATFIQIDFLREHNIRLSQDCNVVFDTVLYYELLRYQKPLLTSAIFSGMRYHDTNKTTHSGVLSTEFQKYIKPYIKQYALWRRVLHRLLQTRFHKFFYALILYLTWRGYLPYARDWKAAILDRHAGDLKLVNAHQAMFGLGHID